MRDDPRGTQRDAGTRATRGLPPLPPALPEDRWATEEERVRFRAERAAWQREVRRILRRRGRRITPEPIDPEPTRTDTRSARKRRAPYPVTATQSAATPPRRPSRTSDETGWRTYQPTSAGTAKPASAYDPKSHQRGREPAPRASRRQGNLREQNPAEPRR